MTICHIGTMGDISKEGMITQYIFNDCIGNHCYIDLYDEPIKADIYILHCFKNQKHFPNQILWEKPEGSRLISLIHSGEPCMPAKESDVIITITNAWKKRLKELYNIDSVMIYGGIDLEKYENAKIDYDSMVFGKISRPEAGKYHALWNEMIENILYLTKAECRIISNNYKKLNYLFHPRMKWIEGIKINDHAAKVRELSKMSIYIECHDDGGNAFIDTFCMSVLEAMACGLPILIYKGLQEAMTEVIGNAGIICDDIKMFQKELVNLLNDRKSREYYGKLAKERAKFFDKNNMIKQWDILLEGLC